MDRRELLKMVALVTGTAFIGGEFFLSGCKNPEAGPSKEFSEDDIALLDEVGETILPKTNTPGAKDAKVGAYMAIMVNDCYTAADQAVFHEGLKKLNDECKTMHDVSFMKATPEQRKSLLVKLDEEAKKDAKERKKRPAHYFSMMKQLTISGYFSSKEGRTGALRYTPVPGKYDGDLDYKKGDRAFAGLKD